ncbi:MAG: transposase zinc-binding domain-containing protein [Ardenticatenaceae bacterium]|nr:transposase zinc-binding domain-containing protein [Ardenticatenaceae bacterium]
MMPQVILGTPKPQYEVADVFRQYGEAYRRKHRLSQAQREAMRAIEQCRTAALGGHVDECDTCGVLRIAYNSCRNRHCPKCGALEKARWLEARQAELLPVAYFHIVFTLDHAIHPLARWNQTAIHHLLFQAAAEALKEFGARYLGGEVGIVAVLHTWGQDLSQHLHLHCIVTGGALSFDRQAWCCVSSSNLSPPGQKIFIENELTLSISGTIGRSASRYRRQGDDRGGRRREDSDRLLSGRVEHPRD